MGSTWTRLVAGVGVVLLSVSMGAAGPKTGMSGKQKHKVVPYECDGEGKKMGLPGGVFQVKYIAGGGSSVAVLPVDKNLMTLARVATPSGAKYAANTFTWLADGSGATFTSDSATGKVRSFCRVNWQPLAPAPPPLDQPPAHL